MKRLKFSISRNVEFLKTHRFWIVRVAIYTNSRSEEDRWLVTGGFILVSCSRPFFVEISDIKRFKCFSTASGVKIKVLLIHDSVIVFESSNENAIGWYLVNSAPVLIPFSLAFGLIKDNVDSSSIFTRDKKRFRFSSFGTIGAEDNENNSG